VLAGAALFTALGGPAWAARLINGAEIKNGSITSKKIAAAVLRPRERLLRTWLNATGPPLPDRVPAEVEPTLTGRLRIPVHR
jgi:hypothetical protein